MTHETHQDGQTDTDWEEVKFHLGFLWWCVTEDFVTYMIFGIGLVWIIAQIWTLL